MRIELAMRIRRWIVVVIVLATGPVFADCGGKLIPPADEVTTRMNAKDETALKRADAGAAPDAGQR